MSEVTVYSKNGCAACTMTKNVLNAEGINFVEHNVEQEPEYLTQLQMYGYNSLPVVAVGSLDNAWAGFQPDRIKSLAKRELGK